MVRLNQAGRTARIAVGLAVAFALGTSLKDRGLTAKRSRGARLPRESPPDFSTPSRRRIPSRTCGLFDRLLSLYSLSTQR